MKWLLALSAVSLLVSGTVSKHLIDINIDNGDAVDVLFLIQASAGLLDDRPQVAESVMVAVEKLQGKDVQFGLASFVDKPNVGVGLGEYGGWPAGHDEDYCYKLHLTMSESSDQLYDSIINLPRASGLDVNEGHVEALTRLTHDSVIAWRANANKVVIVFTNTLPHAGDYDPLHSYVDQFNSNLQCVTDASGNIYTTGGFGSMVQSPSLAGLIMWTPWESEYATYTDLLLRDRCGVEPDLSDEDRDTMSLYEKAVFAPMSVDPVKAFDFATQKLDPAGHCQKHEYPTWGQTAQILKESGIKLVVAVVDLPATRMFSSRVTVYPKGFSEWYRLRAPPTYEVIWNWILCSKAEGMGNMESDLIFVPHGDTITFAHELEKTLTSTSHLDCADINPEEPSTEPTTTSEEVCGSPEIQVITLMDASGSWATRGGETSRKLAEALVTIKEAYPAAHLGLASFVDKPNVGHGLGTFGGYQTPAADEDWCYKLIQPLSSDINSADLETMITKQQWGWGMDAPEAHLEAVMNVLTDPNVGWSTNANTEKILLVVTDDVAHAGWDYLPITPDIDTFNSLVLCSGSTTRGGFGSLSHGIYDLRSWTNNDTSYYRLSELLAMYVCGTKEYTDAELQELTDLYALLDPTSVPAIKPFDLNKLKTDSHSHCKENEYPDYQTVRDALNAADVNIIVLILDFNDDSSTVVTPSSASRASAAVDTAEQHRGEVPLEQLPQKMQDIFARSNTRAATSRASASISDVWSWVLTDSSALGGTKNFQATVAPTEVDSFIAPVLSGLASLVPACA